MNIAFDFHFHFHFGNIIMLNNRRKKCNLAITYYIGFLQCYHPRGEYEMFARPCVWYLITQNNYM